MPNILDALVAWRLDTGAALRNICYLHGYRFVSRILYNGVLLLYCVLLWKLSLSRDFPHFLGQVSVPVSYKHILTYAQGSEKNITREKGNSGDIRNVLFI
jgi:hypothetical protein